MCTHFSRLLLMWSIFWYGCMLWLKCVFVDAVLPDVWPGIVAVPTDSAPCGDCCCWFGLFLPEPGDIFSANASNELNMFLLFDRFSSNLIKNGSSPSSFFFLFVVYLTCLHSLTRAHSFLLLFSLLFLFFASTFESLAKTVIRREKKMK